MYQLNIVAQTVDLFAINPGQGEEVTHHLFTGDGSGFSMSEAFLARQADLNESHPHLTVSADFTGDGLDEIAHFENFLYTPNMNPDFTHSYIWVGRSRGDSFLPSGGWFSMPDSSLNFGHVDFSVAADFNQDGYSDIALFYNDHSSDQLTIYVLQSNGSGFSDPLMWYSCDRNDFNFTSMKFAQAGDFNGNEKPDIAVYYNYPGTAPETRQSVFLFESQGNSFSLLPRVYDATKASYDFTHMKFALPGDYNLDGVSDVAVLHEDPVDQDLTITVFEGSSGGQLSPVDFNSFVDTIPTLSHIHHAAGANFSGDTATDLAFFYDNPGNGMQEILVLESELSSFTAPARVYSVEAGVLSMADLSVVCSGRFNYEPVVSPATWKDDRRGAISFTFDDGYQGAFEHGGEELETAGLKGTFYIFTDTSSTYDGELASPPLVREYKNKGHEIASHTSNHANLGLLTASGDLDSLDQLLSASLELLNERFDQFTMTMSFPYGSFLSETLEHISGYFYSARSSQHGFNLATPYDLYALKSWPVLSTTSPASVDTLLSMAETYGTYLPLMYHNVVDTVFDEDLYIYTYSRQLFSETLVAAQGRDLWIDTHERVYKYIRERNALKISDLEDSEMDLQGGNFSFVADDGLPDSVFNIGLTLKISLPQSWTEDTVTIGPENNYSYVKVQQLDSDPFIYFNWLPVSDVSIQVHDGIVYATGSFERKQLKEKISLVAAPNPFLLETRIRVSGTYHPDDYLRVRDIHGRIVQELRKENGDTFSISGADLSPGIYVAQLIRDGNTLASLKLMVL